MRVSRSTPARLATNGADCGDNLCWAKRQEPASFAACAMSVAHRSPAGPSARQYHHRSNPACRGHQCRGPRARPAAGPQHGVGFGSEAAGARTGRLARRAIAACAATTTGRTPAADVQRDVDRPSKSSLAGAIHVCGTTRLNRSLSGARAHHRRGSLLRCWRGERHRAPTLSRAALPHDDPRRWRCHVNTSPVPAPWRQARDMAALCRQQVALSWFRSTAGLPGDHLPPARARERVAISGGGEYQLRELAGDASAAPTPPPSCTQARARHRRRLLPGDRPRPAANAVALPSDGEAETIFGNGRRRRLLRTSGRVGPAQP